MGAIGATYSHRGMDHTLRADRLLTSAARQVCFYIRVPSAVFNIYLEWSKTLQPSGCDMIPSPEGDGRILFLR